MGAGIKYSRKRAAAKDNYYGNLIRSGRETCVRVRVLGPSRIFTERVGKTECVTPTAFGPPRPSTCLAKNRKPSLSID